MLQRASVHKPDAAPSALSRIGRRFGSWPAIVFALLSLFFGSAIIVVNPPLRGPDEISHFLRIYSYTRGELLPVTEINGRKGIFVERVLYERLHFFKDSGERFAISSTAQGKWFVGIETRESATARSWPSIMTSSAREMMRPHKRLCSRRLPAQKATVRSPMLLIYSRQLSDVCSASIYPNCCS